MTPPHKLMGVSLRKPNGFIENLNTSLFIDSPYKPDLTSTKRQGVNKTDPLGQISQTNSDESGFPLTDQPSFQVGVVGFLKGLRVLAQCVQRPEPIPLPDFLLPEPIVTLDGRIGGGPSLGGKDRDHPTGQTEPDQLADTSGMHPATGQAHIVVHLQKVWNPMMLPIPCQKRQNVLDPPVGLFGPKDKAGGRILPVQDDHGTPRSQVVSYDEVDLMDVVPFFGYGPGQDRTFPRPIPALAGQKLVTNQNPMNRADGMQGVDSQIDQLVVNRFGSIESQRVSLTFEPSMGSDDQTLEGVAHTPSQSARTLGSIQKPCLPAVAIPMNPFVNPWPASSQQSSNPTDGSFFQPQSDALFPFSDPPRTFFDSYTDPPSYVWEEIVPFSLLSSNCQRCVVSLYVNDVLSCDH